MTRTLARGEQAGNGLIVPIEHLGVRVDVQAAHRVMHGRLVNHDVVGRRVHLAQLAAVLEVGIGTRVHIPVPSIERLLQSRRIDLEGRAGLFKRIGLDA